MRRSALPHCLIKDMRSCRQASSQLQELNMAASQEVEWASCVKPLLSASYSSFNKNNIPDLVESIIKRYVGELLRLLWQGVVDFRSFFRVCLRRGLPFLLAVCFSDWR